MEKKLSFTGGRGGGGGGGGGGGHLIVLVISMAGPSGLSFQFTVCHFSLWSVITEGALEKLY